MKVKNKFRVFLDREEFMVDLFKWRLRFRWVDAGDGRTPVCWWSFFKRPFNY